MATATKPRLSGSESLPNGKDKVGELTVTIAAPNYKIVEFLIEGTAPYVQHKFSSEARGAIRKKQEAGSTQQGRKKRVAKDFDAAYKEALHTSTDGWHGIPASAFRSALIDACRLTDMPMTKGKMSCFTVADGYDEHGEPLVKIIKGKPKPIERTVRISISTTDVRVRPMWRAGWQAKVRIKYDADQFTAEDVANLMNRAGSQVGIGEGRPFSKSSHGCGWGTFEIKS